MKVLSLFDGISCGRVALERAGIKVTEYYASEIDPYAIQISKNNYPDIKHLGDINNAHTWDIPKPDLIIGGSPCQGFSFAGKQLAFKDPRSALFFKFVEILGFYNPKFFLLENVKMKREFSEVISCVLNVDPICINSTLVSAQNRVRYYWTNIPGVDQPTDRNIYLKDILEEDGTGWIKNHNQWYVRNEKSMCLCASYYKGADNRGQRTMIKCGSMIGRKINPETGKRDDLNPELETVQRIELREDDKTGTLTTVQKDNLVFKGLAQDIKGYISRRRVYGVEGKSPALVTPTGGRSEPKIAIDNTFYRKLTPIECERLQTLPDNYTHGVSSTQRYKTLGNGWTVDVLAHIFKNIGE